MLSILPLAVCANAQERVVDRRFDGEPAPRGDALLRRAMLDGHTVARRARGVPPLAWMRVAGHGCAALGGRARAQRSLPSLGPAEPHGAGRESVDGYARVVPLLRDGWALCRRASRLVDAPTPGFSRPGWWQDVAHYTQIIWRGATAVGCAVAANARDEVLVCRYTPAGNVVGRRAY